MVYSEIEKYIRQKLHGIYPEREIASIAILVAEYLTGDDRMSIRLNPHTELSGIQIDKLAEMADRLLGYEPVQYVTGETEFYGLKLKVGPGVLIPRGETEELADWILKAQGSEMKAQGTRHNAQVRNREEKEKKVLRVLDVGCGSGAIAIVLAKFLPGAEVVAADISEIALSVTAENAVLNHVVVRTSFLDILSCNGPCHPGENRDPFPSPASHTFPCHPGESRDPFPSPASPPDQFAPFDIIVSNPPYIPLRERSSMAPNVTEHEPDLALFVPDSDPLLFYRAIAVYASIHLVPDGEVFVEIHDQLGKETAELFGKWFLNVELRKDIHGKDRMIRASNG